MNLKKNLATIALGATLTAGVVTTAAVAVPALAGATSATSEADVPAPQRGQVLEGVLGDLVADGTLTQAQADAVSGAVSAKRDEVRDQLAQRRAERAEQLAGFLGITTDELRSELQSGKSLAQIAEGHGKTREQLVTAMVDAVNSRVDEAVAAGKLTAEQADKIKAGAPDRIDKIVDRVPGSGDGGGHRGGLLNRLRH